MTPTIVFVSHEASLTGAPILLLNIVTWLKEHSKYELIVVLGKDGPLRRRFECVANVINYFVVPPYWMRVAGMRRIFSIEAYQEAHYRKSMKGKDVRAIFSNTIANGTLVNKIVELNTPVITYVHELQFTIQMQMLFHGDISLAISRTDFFLAGSNAVRKNLIDMGVVPSIIEVAFSSIPIEELNTKLMSIDKASERNELGIVGDNQFLVAVGTASWRKGSDLFIQLANKLSTLRPSLQFAWVGVDKGSIEYLQMSYEVNQYNLSNRFHLIPVSADYLKYIAMADVFALTSREDPFPLVVLEAGLAGKPIVCFENAGGAAEFVSDKNGSVVPYGDIDAMAREIILLLDNDYLRNYKGKNARNQVCECHSIPVVVAQIMQIIERYID